MKTFRENQSRATRLAEILAMVEGRLETSPQRSGADAETLLIGGAAPPYEVGPDEITLFSHGGGIKGHPECAAAAALVSPTAAPPTSDASPVHVIVDNPHEAFARLVTHFRPPVSAEESFHPDHAIAPTAEIDPDATIHATAVIGPRVRIGPATRIGPGVRIAARSVIGRGCVLHAGVMLYPHTQLGDRVTIHGNSVLGAEGFGFRTVDGQHMPTPQLGYVVIEEDVEIGACVTIDRGSFGTTRIGQGSKIDNQVMIAHNCQIGRHNLLCSQVGVAGSCRTGDHVVLAGQVGLRDHIELDDHVIVGAQAGVMQDLKGPEVYLGTPATRQKEQMQIMAIQRRLPELRRELKRLERLVGRPAAEEVVSSPRRAA